MLSHIAANFPLGKNVASFEIFSPISRKENHEIPGENNLHLPLYLSQFFLELLYPVL